MMLSFRFSRILSTIAYFPSWRPTPAGFYNPKMGPSLPLEMVEDPRPLTFRAVVKA
jgi:hypothetical protein